jgi:branched-chain amino acid transport system substrate-binding protein
MNRPRTSIRLLAGAIALTSLTAACGLKPDATATLKTGAGAAAAAASNGIAPGAPGSAAAVPGAPGSAGNAPGTVAGGPPGAVAAGGSNSGGTVAQGGGTSSGGRPATGGACGVPHNGTTTGVTASTINLGLHAPLTGTGTPFPNSSFQAGAATYWQQPGHEVCGRKVQVEFKDDTYTPSGATKVCTDMAKRDFLVVGGGGTDQIQACATTPAIQQLGVPYLSPGVTDNGLTGLSNYFAVSLSYSQQGSLVLRNAQQQGIANPSPSTVDSDNMSGQKAVWAIVTANTKNFEGASHGIETALNAAHIPYKDYKVDQNGNYQSAATQFGSQLAINGFKTIFVDAAPGYFVFMSGGYYGASSVNTANWVGPGVTYTEVTVAQYICSGSKNQINGHAWFLAPAPGLDRATQEFKQAYSGKYDDIEWALWGLSETLWKLLTKADANLTRQNFIASTEHAVLPAGSVYPPIDYAHHGGHFGGTGAWVQRVNCGETEPDQNQNGAWDTVGSSYLRLF